MWGVPAKTDIQNPHPTRLNRNRRPLHVGATRVALTVGAAVHGLATVVERPKIARIAGRPTCSNCWTARAFWKLTRSNLPHRATASDFKFGGGHASVSCFLGPMKFLTRVPFDLNGPLTIAILSRPTVSRRRHHSCSEYTTAVNCSSVWDREIARHPPPLGRGMVGGVAVR